MPTTSWALPPSPTILLELEDHDKLLVRWIIRPYNRCHCRHLRLLVSINLYGRNNQKKNFTIYTGSGLQTTVVLAPASSTQRRYCEWVHMNQIPPEGWQLRPGRACLKKRDANAPSSRSQSSSMHNISTVTWSQCQRSNDLICILNTIVIVLI